MDYFIKLLLCVLSTLCITGGSIWTELEPGKNIILNLIYIREESRVVILLNKICDVVNKEIFTEILETIKIKIQFCSWNKKYYNFEFTISSGSYATSFSEIVRTIYRVAEREHEQFITKEGKGLLSGSMFNVEENSTVNKTIS